MSYVEPRTHALRPTLSRSEVDEDVLRLAEVTRDLLSCEELWYVLQQYKARITLQARGWSGDEVEFLLNGGGRV